MSRNAKIAISAGVVAAGVAVIVYSALGNSLPYKYVDGVMGDPDRWESKAIQLHGNVESGSIEEKIEDQTTKTTFVLYYKDKRIKVTHQGGKPDTFRDEAQVVATGRLRKDPNGEPFFEAKELLAKCPSKYESAGGTLQNQL